MKALAAIIAIVAAGIVLAIIFGGVSNEPPKPIEIPVAKGHVNDYADILSPATETALEADLRAYTPEIAVLTVKDMGGLDVNEYAIKVAEAWKVGDADVSPIGSIRKTTVTTAHSSRVLHSAASVAAHSEAAAQQEDSNQEKVTKKPRKVVLLP